MYQFVLFSIFRIVSFCFYCLSNVRLILFRIFFSLTSAETSIVFWLNFCLVRPYFNSTLKISVGCIHRKKASKLYWDDWEKKTQIKYILYWLKQVLVVATVVHSFCVHPIYNNWFSFFSLSPLIVFSRVPFICSS